MKIDYLEIEQTWSNIPNTQCMNFFNVTGCFFGMHSDRQFRISLPIQNTDKNSGKSSENSNESDPHTQIYVLFDQVEIQNGEIYIDPEAAFRIRCVQRNAFSVVHPAEYKTPFRCKHTAGCRVYFYIR